MLFLVFLLDLIKLDDLTFLWFLLSLSFDEGGVRLDDAEAHPLDLPESFVILSLLIFHILFGIKSI